MSVSTKAATGLLVLALGVGALWYATDSNGRKVIKIEFDVTWTPGDKAAHIAWQTPQDHGEPTKKGGHWHHTEYVPMARTGVPRVANLAAITIDPNAAAHCTITVLAKKAVNTNFGKCAARQTY